MATEDQIEDLKDHQKSGFGRLEEYATDVLWSFIERDASNWKFWVKVSMTMFFVTAGPAIVIALFFLGRDLGYFE
ncbi:MAG: hypothetical protein GY946_27775 [bacterium]|nr:hypothetical protein [bacterium]